MVRDRPVPPAFRAVGLLRFAGGRLANQLYYALQAHVRGHGSMYAVNDDRWVRPLAYLGCRGLILSSAEAAGRRIHVENDPRQVLWRDFTMGDVASFVRRYILTSEAYRSVSGSFTPDQGAIAVHVRNTDYLVKRDFNIIDRDEYLLDALTLARSRFVGDGVPSSIHVFSDDIMAARTSFDGLFREFSSNIVYQPCTTAEDDLVRLALYRNKVILNSTFGTWAGYIGDVVHDRGTHVVVPSEFHSVGRRHGMCEIADPVWDMVEVSPTRSEDSDHVALVWSTDGGNADCLLESMRSFDEECDDSVSFAVLTQNTGLDFSGMSREVTVVDPVPALARIGLFASEHVSKRFKFACMYKLAIPLLDRFRRFKAVCSVDADTVVVSPAVWKLDGRRCWSFASLFDYPLHDCEVAGASDQWIDDMRCAHLVNRCCPDDIRADCERLVWSVAGSSQKSYINVGVLLWNLGAIDTEFYVRRVQAFWRQSRANPAMFRWPEQDFVNGFMRVDAGLSIRFNCLNNNMYNRRYVCLLHFAGQSGKLSKIQDSAERNRSARLAISHSGKENQV
jgi:hypothetical protein